MACPYMDVCPSPREIGTGPIYKRRFCMHNCQGCARYSLTDLCSPAEQPRWLRPTMMAHADALRESARHGLRRIPLALEDMPPVTQLMPGCEPVQIVRPAAGAKH